MTSFPSISEVFGSWDGRQGSPRAVGGRHAATDRSSVPWADSGGETRLATKSLRGQLAHRLDGILNDDKIGIVTANGGFSSSHVRKAVMDIGCVPIIPERSGSNGPESIAAAKAANAERLSFAEYPKWRALAPTSRSTASAAMAPSPGAFKRSGRAVTSASKAAAPRAAAPQRPPASGTAPATPTAIATSPPASAATPTSEDHVRARQPRDVHH